ncbi:MAG TPA: N-acetylmuramoyl-L-alanine amidase [Pseudolabrys sp.]|jgi:N-acetylmuramoyl-L-alanine amidase|nr:N-acetylmuramoyl-L-alanine amidase [Pseudolabrys sp.]
MIHHWRMIAVLLAVLLFALPLDIARAEPTASPAKSDAPNCVRPNFRVVLDVGHTARSPGAKSARGTDEFDFNLRLGKQVDQALLEAGFAKTVLMVSEGRANSSLYARVARANDLSANLLLSIHHDSVPDRFIERWEYNGKRQVFSDRFKGHSIFVSDDNIDQKDSLLFGSMLGQQLKARGLHYTPHYTESFMGRWKRVLLDAIVGVYRYDTLFVLKKAQMPAVLLEAGSIANRDEELEMASPERQQLISAAVVDAVDSFCAAQSNKPALQIAKTSKARHVLSAHSHRRTRERTANATPPTPVSSAILDIH